MQTINIHQAANLIRQSGGRLFGVTFAKRSDGSLRRMVARRGVSKGVTGEGLSFEPSEHDLLTVFEFQNHKGQYRSVPIEGIRRLKIQGQEYQVA